MSIQKINFLNFLFYVLKYCLECDIILSEEVIHVKISTTAKRLSEYMAMHGKRQVDLLEMLKPYCEEHGVKIGKSEISQYISGKFEPGSEKIYVLSVALGVNTLWLMGYDEPMYVEEKPADQYDELDNILADLMEKIPTKLSEAILKLSPQGIDRLLEYAEFLLERESSGSSAK